MKLLSRVTAELINNYVWCHSQFSYSWAYPVHCPNNNRVTTQASLADNRVAPSRSSVADVAINMRSKPWRVWRWTMKTLSIILATCAQNTSMKLLLLHRWNRFHRRQHRWFVLAMASHTLLLCQLAPVIDRKIFTVCSVKDSAPRRLKFIRKVERGHPDRWC